MHFCHILLGKPSKKKLKVWIFLHLPDPPPPKVWKHILGGGGEIFSNFTLKMTFQPTKTGWNRTKFFKKNKKYLKKCGNWTQEPPNPLKIHTFLKLWILGLGLFYNCPAFTQTLLPSFSLFAAEPTLTKGSPQEKFQTFSSSPPLKV